jgi:O-antigen biosynthesis protein
LFHLVIWLKAHSWNVSVVVPKLTTRESGPITDKLVQNGIDVFPIIDLSRPLDLPELRSLCRNFDVVIANTLVMWAPVQAAHAEGLPTIWYIHESLVGQQLIMQFPEIRPTLEMADLLVTPTRRTAELYAPFTQRPIEILPYGIPTTSPPKIIVTRNNSLTFLLLGSYESRKGQDVFVQAIGQLPATVRERARFRMAGRKLELEFYDRLARAAATLPNVELLDALEHDEACAAVTDADVLVCASRDETMPIAILEAMSLLKAIISTTVGGIAEWLRNGVNGLLVPPEDPAALAEAIRRCVEEPELLDSLGSGARETFVENFSIDRLGENFIHLIARALRTQSQ